MWAVAVLVMVAVVLAIVAAGPADTIDRRVTRTRRRSLRRLRR